MELNNWENRPSEFLSNVFNEDEDDIIRCLQSIAPKVVMEIGFGNNRLLPAILNNVDISRYHGFDKTKTFIRRARTQYNLDNVSFRKLNIEYLNKLHEVVDKIKPEVIILRYIIEHIPKWKSVLACLNTLSIPNIIISTYTQAPLHRSWSMLELSRRGGRAYTVNFISERDFTRTLNSYILKTHKTYYSFPHVFRHYETLDAMRSLKNLTNYVR